MVSRDNIKMFMTELGPIVGEVFPDTEVQAEVTEDGAVGLSAFDPFVTLHHPFRLMPNQGGTVNVASIFIKEEWVKFNPSRFIELSVPDSVKNLYVEYEQQVFGSIVLANTIPENV